MKIILHPLANGLVSVTVRCSDKITRTVGPLFDTTVVSKYTLGKLVMLTAANAYREVQHNLLGAIQSFAVRQRFLSDIIRRYRSPDQHASSLYQSLFLQPSARSASTDSGSCVSPIGSSSSTTSSGPATPVLLPPRFTSPDTSAFTSPSTIAVPPLSPSPTLSHHYSTSQSSLPLPPGGRGVVLPPPPPRIASVPYEHARTQSSQTSPVGLVSPPTVYEDDMYSPSPVSPNPLSQSTGSQRMPVVRPKPPVGIPGIVIPGQQPLPLPPQPMQQMQFQQHGNPKR